MSDKKYIQPSDDLLNIIPSPLFYKDHEGRYQYFNQQFLDYLGLTRDELYHKTVYDIAPHKLATIYDNADQSLMASKGSQVYEAEVKYADGSLHPTEFTKVVDVDSKGKVIGILGLMKDLSEQKKENARNLLTDRMKETMLYLNNNITAYKDEHEFFDDVLLNFQELFGYSQRSSILVVDDDKQVRVKASIGYNKNDTNRFILPLEKTFIYLESQGDLTTSCIINDLSRYLEAKIPSSDPSGGEGYIQSSLEIPILVKATVRYIISIDSIDNNVFGDNDLYVANFILTQFQILLRVFHLYQSTLHLSRYDDMTGLMNRRYFDLRLEQMMQMVDQGEPSFHLILFDLDDLKSMNDTYGHHIGDRFIITFSRLLSDYLSDTSLLGRIGGDEFVALVYKMPIETIIEKVHHMKTTFKTMIITMDNGNVTGDFSYGLQSYEPNMSLRQLMRFADQKMYKNKCENKNS